MAFRDMRTADDAEILTANLRAQSAPYLAQAACEPAGKQCYLRRDPERERCLGLGDEVSIGRDGVIHAGDAQKIHRQVGFVLELSFEPVDQATHDND